MVLLQSKSSTIRGTTSHLIYFDSWIKITSIHFFTSIITGFIISLLSASRKYLFKHKRETMITIWYSLASFFWEFACDGRYELDTTLATTKKLEHTSILTLTCKGLFIYSFSSAHSASSVHAFLRPLLDGSKTNRFIDIVKNCIVLTHENIT